MFVNIIYMYSYFIPYFYANIVNKVLIIIIIIIREGGSLLLKGIVLLVR